MKAKLFTKAIAMMLSVIMVISLLPLSVFAYESNSNMEYVDGGVAEAARYEQLGYGFNALSDTAIKDTTLKSSAGVVINYDAVKASLLSTSYSEADVKYAKTAQDLMLSFGIDYTNQSSVGLPIENAKFGFASKFGFSADIKYKTITESLYYYYREEILTGKYSLVIPAQMLDDPEQIISEDFVYALEKLNTNYSDEKCADFFNKWGTHILISYNKGAALEYVAVGHSTGKEFSANAEITNEMSASAGIGDLKAESTQALAVKLGVAYNSSEYNLTHKWFGMGGDSNLIGANGADASTISATSIENWKATVSQDKSVLIPQSTEWISVWELIPDSYAGAKTALQTYYKTKATGVNAAFFSQFTTYSEVSGSAELYYTSPTGYTSKIAYYADGTTKVAPNSKLNVVNLGADLSNIVFPKSNYYTVDEYGVVTISSTAPVGQKLKVLVTDLEGKEITGASKTFTVEKEGAGLYAGGYGTAERPYLISNATEFSNIRNYSSAVFSLTNSISLGTISPIDSFSGTLDGNGYTLSGWSHTQTTVGNLGLFLSNTGTIKNISIANFQIGNNDPNVVGTLKVGLICGSNAGTIENIGIAGSKINVDVGNINADNNNYIYVGMLTGYNNGVVRQVISEGNTISAYAGTHYQGTKVYAGGIIGFSEGGTVNNIASHGNSISATAKADCNIGWFGECHGHGRPYTYVGGIVGYAKNSTVQLALGYADTFNVKATRDCGCDTNKGSGYGSIIGCREGGSWLNCYTETNHPSTSWLIGNESNTSTGNRLDSLSAVGAIENLNGFAVNGWTQSSSGGHLSIAQNTKLIISGGDREYFIGEPLNLNGLMIQAVKNDAAETKTVITGGYKVSGYDPNKVGTQTVTIAYGNIKGAYTVTVTKPEISGIVISSTPYKNTYFKPFAKTNFEGEKLDFTGLSVVAQYTDGTTSEIPLESLTLPSSTVVTESKSVVISYNGYTANYKIEAFDVLPSKIEVVEDSYKKNYALGDAFDSTGLRVKLTYNNGDTEMLGVDLLTVDSAEFDKDIADTYGITVKYEGLETTFDVIVGSVKSISIATMPDKLSYYSSEKKLATDGLSLNVTYDNGATKVVSAGFSVSGYDNTDIGKQDITVTYGGVTTSFQITVIAVEMTSVEISEYPKTTYFAGNVFTSGGLTLKVNYNDSSYREISSGFTVKLDGYDVDVYPTLVTLGSKKVLVAYSENGIRKTVEYEIEIVKDTITELQVVQDPNKTTYNLWDDFSYSGMMVYAVYASGKAEPVALSNTMFSVQQFTETGTQPVILNYEGRSAEIACTVNAPVSISITKLPSKTEYEIGEAISIDGIEVSAIFADSANKAIDSALIIFNYPSTDTAGSKTVSVNYDSLETTFEIIVKEKSIDENAPMIVMSNARAAKGNTFTVAVSLQNNPGFNALNLSVVYDQNILTLVDSKNLVPDLTMTKVTSYVLDGATDYRGNGELLQLTFKISEDAPAGEYDLQLRFLGASNEDFEEVEMAAISGVLTITDVVYGDTNGDGNVTMVDLSMLRKYFASIDPNTGLSSINIKAGADANGDGNVTMVDLSMLRKYFASIDPETGESSLVLGPKK